MWWSWILGGIFAVAGLFILWEFVTEITLGEYSSRVVGTGLAAVVYYKFAPSSWTGFSTWLEWLIPLALAISVCAFVVRAWNDKEKEFKATVKSSAPLMAAVFFLVAASYLFSL